MAYSIPTRGFESESEGSPQKALNLTNLSAPAPPPSWCHLGLHQAAPTHCPQIIGAALGHRVAPNSATAAAPHSKSAARINSAGPANGETLQASRGPWKQAQTSQQTDIAADTGERKLDARAAHAGRSSLGIEPRNLKTSSDPRSAPASKLRMGSRAPHRLILAVCSDGSPTHPMRPRRAEDDESGLSAYYIPAQACG